MFEPQDDFRLLTEEEKRAYLEELVRKAKEAIDRALGDQAGDEINLWDP